MVWGRTRMVACILTACGTSWHPHSDTQRDPGAPGATVQLGFGGQPSRCPGRCAGSRVADSRRHSRQLFLDYPYMAAALGYPQEPHTQRTHVQRAPSRLQRCRRSSSRASTTATSWRAPSTWGSWVSSSARPRGTPSAASPARSGDIEAGRGRGPDLCPPPLHVPPLRQRRDPQTPGAGAAPRLSVRFGHPSPRL